MPLRLFFITLKNQGFEGRVPQFLMDLEELGEEAANSFPILMDIHRMIPGKSLNVEGEASWGPLRKGIHRRYSRIRFVHRELGKLDFSKARPGADFRDFVFEQIDFSVYRLISPEDFELFSGDGLLDFGDDFFQEAFHLDRAGTAALIRGAYHSQGAYFALRDEKLLYNPLLMSVMRTLHTSLNFAPLFTAEGVLKECIALAGYLEGRPPAPGEAAVGRDAYFHLAQNFGAIYPRILQALDGAVLTHRDGAKTLLSAKSEEASSRDAQGRRGLTLMGIFNPGAKPYTIALTR